MSTACLVIALIPWLQNVTPTGITVMWRMDSVYESTEVQFGEELFTDAVTGTIEVLPGPMFIYSARIENLQPATEYIYRVKAGDQFSQEYSFYTAPEPGTSDFRFYIMGDNRSRPEIWTRLAEQISHDIESNPGSNSTFIINLGDIVCYGNRPESYFTELFNPAGELFANVPFLVAFGNHEDMNTPVSDSCLYGLFDHPGDEKWYSFEYGPLHISSLALWAEEGISFGEQIEWFRDDMRLAMEDTIRPWIIPIMHLLPWSLNGTGEHVNPIPRIRRILHPIMAESGVQAAFGGHNHNYTRYEPIDGVTYITSGGGGGPLNSPDIEPAWSGGTLAYSAPVHHFAAVDVYDDSLCIDIIDIDGEVIDEVTVLN